MQAVEFTAELLGEATLAIPPEAAGRLPKAGRARVIVLPLDDNEEQQRAAYEHFLRDDVPEDAIYDRLR